MAASNTASVSPATAPRLSVLLRGDRNAAILRRRCGGVGGGRSYLDMWRKAMERERRSASSRGGSRRRPTEAAAPPVDVVERQTTRFEDLLRVSREERRRTRRAQGEDPGPTPTPQPSPPLHRAETRGIGMDPGREEREMGGNGFDRASLGRESLPHPSLPSWEEGRATICTEAGPTGMTAVAAAMRWRRGLASLESGVQRTRLLPWRRGLGVRRVWASGGGEGETTTTLESSEGGGGEEKWERRGECDLDFGRGLGKRGADCCEEGKERGGGGGAEARLPEDVGREWGSDEWVRRVQSTEKA
ncbi:unnamed protein product [Urochloa humidicola]